MSRNKTIKLMHEITGRSYKDCRAELKAHHWNSFEVFCSQIDLTSEIFKGLEKTCGTAAEAVSLFGEAIEHFIEDFKRSIEEMSEHCHLCGNDTQITVIDEVIPEQIDSK